MAMLYVFQGDKGIGRAVTDHLSGAALPSLGSGAWEFVRHVDVGADGGSFIGADLATVSRAVAKDGFYKWP